MSCIYHDESGKRCGKEGSYETSTWNVGALCTDHFTKVEKSYGAVPRPQVLDFVKVHVLLQFNTDKCLECIKRLENEMTVAKGITFDDDPRFSKSPQDSSKYLKLSRALEYYEGYCWFPANRVMFTGILDAKDFFKYVKYGFNKDPGAGPIHGDQSHRLQWHVIMRCMTDNFRTPIYKEAGWNHSPLGLFYEYTQGAGTYTGRERSGAWGISMDSRKNEGWGNPDKIGSYIIQSNTPKIAQALLHRMQKMGGANTTEADVTLGGEEFALRFERLGTFQNGLIASGIGGGFMAFYEDKKVITDRTYKRPLDKHNKLIRDKHNNPIKVLIPKSAPDPVIPINRERVNRSESKFNSQYLYSRRFGAEPSVDRSW